MEHLDNHIVELNTQTVALASVGIGETLIDDDSSGILRQWQTQVFVLARH